MNQDKEKKHQRQPFAKTIAEGQALGGAGAAVVAPAPTTQPQQQQLGGVQPLVLNKEDCSAPLSPSSTSPIQLRQPEATSPSALSADGGSDEEEHLQIPRPNNVPQRKASILHPSVHSKLSPQPHIHHEHNEDLSS